MSEDHNLPEDENNNSLEENLVPDAQKSRETLNLSSEVNAEGNDLVDGSVNEEPSDDVFGAEGDEDVFDDIDAIEEVEAGESLESRAREEQSNIDPLPIKKKVEDSRRWYSLRVISGKERKIKERIELEISRSKWGDFVTQILVPSEKVYKIRNGKKVILERNILPGYILVEADPARFTGEMVQAIANVPNVIHFLGRNNPIPMQQSEANRMLGKLDESQSLSEAMVEPFIIGETVKIIDGPFNEFVGDIQEVNEEKKKLKVIVKIFGRGTEVELNFMQVEKQQ
ncbi:transcription termination/antitermination protein NusG [Saprospiraceae bacterium]|nr:transcription termination/antitermination protein NusG [Saprospiraceae bacterium]MDC3219900.1 transcription termination/antitermination protein NusG [Saprospiraceae bacterium]